MGWNVIGTCMCGYVVLWNLFEFVWGGDVLKSQIH